MRHDLLLTGGHVIDPASGVDGRRDVAFASGRVAAVDTVDSARDRAGGGGRVRGVRGAGAHRPPRARVHRGPRPRGSRPTPCAPRPGVTTLCDAGSTGAANFAGLREYVMARAETRVLGFLHIAAIGLSHLAIGEHCYLDYSDPDLAAGGGSRAPGRRHRHEGADPEGGRRPAWPRASPPGTPGGGGGGVPVIVHVNNPPVEYGEVLALLRPGRHREPLPPRPRLGDPRRAGAGQGGRAGRAPPGHRLRRGPRPEPRELPRGAPGVRAGLLPGHDLLGSHAAGPRRASSAISRRRSRSS